ncbi:protein-S isoprenylcysteine O-methyltransferase Mam4 [Schizosaccharomyces japonicus yFS275]|uniref:Protein-S-isoprenylcysteine O-methyltransferase n=1 Tax=Schizosaccharomyces japonicus (strain yFS275 / FY16936) TaxID=402676 RepID=B6K8D8_SCHJY|nr:protein-S isoprenylcysteine O-methyltransferase Mam4 [Schizosaccharomyces japonicus yFS275]EEB09792.1 protein-S isoprenylcysteine O-methyltransferase Mam4 [Schizosaccharomyces japonicus yFS275]
MHTTSAVGLTALTAATLGCIFGSGLVFWLFTRFGLSLFLAQLALFHLLEYLITARFQPSKLSFDSFILNNGNSYWYAMLLGVIEYCLCRGNSGPGLLSKLFMPRWICASIRLIMLLVGLVAVVIGQALRSFAMIHAGESFSHVVATEKKQEHKLVTDGIYHYVRHPSYAGFFVWALGTQLCLRNVFSTAIFGYVLWRFFDSRIHYEEQHLTTFFGDAYKEYKSRVPSGLPGIH